jgi:hypothetical protein
VLRCLCCAAHGMTQGIAVRVWLLPQLHSVSHAVCSRVAQAGHVVASGTSPHLQCVVTFTQLPQQQHHVLSLILALSQAPL